MALVASQLIVEEKQGVHTDQAACEASHVSQAAGVVLDIIQVAFLFLFKYTLGVSDVVS